MMMPAARARQQGFTYVGLLIAIVIMGLMLTPVSSFARGLAALAAKKSEGSAPAAEVAAEEAPAAA